MDDKYNEVNQSSQYNPFAETQYDHVGGDIYPNPFVAEQKAAHEWLKKQHVDRSPLMLPLYGGIQPANKEYTNDSAQKAALGAIKLDGGKPCAYRGAISYFPRAVEAVAAVSTFGASKYAWEGWRGVDDGLNRYSDAMVRHLLREGEKEVVDPDSRLLHAAHTAWNALARLELILQEKDRYGVPLV